MNEHVLITGGTKGIGKAVACCLAKAGYSLVLTYASDTLAAETLRDELVQSYQVKVSLLQADVTILLSPSLMRIGSGFSSRIYISLFSFCNV